MFRKSFRIRLDWPAVKSLMAKIVAWALLAVVPISSNGQVDATTPKDAILVLDASGSMWGQIDGINKIVIAKDVVEQLIHSLPAEQRLGMVAYGHRKKGECSDIETIADVGADKNSVIKQIRQLSPKGMTPLSQSLEHAATELNYTQRGATVILVSDGLENCSADPCELAKTLEENGLDFTVHVVGFDVTPLERKGLACIAKETGGEFLTADTADELAGALTQVAAPQLSNEPPQTVEKPQAVSLKATILKGGPDIQRNLNWSVIDKASDKVIFEAQQTGYADLEIMPGEYTAKAVWTGWPHKSDRYKGDKSGSRDFTIAAAPTVVTVPVDLDIPLEVDADREIAEGMPVTVRWFGPDDLGVVISTNALDDGPRDKIYFTPGQRARDAYEKNAVQNSEPIDTTGDEQFNQDDFATTQVGGPSTAGNYEVRYTLTSPLVILARSPLKVTDSAYAVSVQPSVMAADTFPVEWSGPITPGDFVTIIEKDSKNTFSNGHTAKLVEGKPAQLTAFAEPGEYEVRYILANGYTTYPNTQHAVQAVQPITILPAKAGIVGPKEAVGGSTINVELDVPGDSWSNDMLSVIDVGALNTNSDSRAGLQRIKQPDGTFQIRVPAKAGEYEIAYFLYPGAKVIARAPLKISTAQATVDAPAEVKAGTDFEVKYSGDGFYGDRIIICPVDTPDAKMWSWGTNYGFAARANETLGMVKGGYKATKVAGEYEARYVTGLQHLVLAREKFTVVE